MMRRNFLRSALEMIVDVGFLILGITILTFIFQNQPFDRPVIGALILSVGVLDFADFFTWQYATKMRSIQSLIAAVLNVALGVVILSVHNMDPKIMCIVWGACSVAFSITKIITCIVNITYQPLINGAKIILNILEIVFSIILMIRTINAIPSHMLFLAISLIVEAFILFIEFIINHNQKL
ncbi:MAG: hypothetical protein MJ216_01000 [Bacilli bacterium]|nr:hypothetical protein [Bacilli bacterium]